MGLGGWVHVLCRGLQYCEHCQAAMCNEHDTTSHTRGRRKRHVRTRLHVCGVCNYQNATRKCLHCHSARFQCDTVRGG